MWFLAYLEKLESEIKREIRIFILTENFEYIPLYFEYISMTLLSDDCYFNNL